MTGKDRLLAALRFQQPDRPPHFEVMFELEREAFGLAFPPRTAWEGCTTAQKDRMVRRCVEIYERIVERYAWDGLAVYWPWSDPDGVAAAKRAFGERILVGGIVGDSTWSIDHIKDWEAFSLALAERPTALHDEARAMSARAFSLIDRMVDAGADFVHIVNDVAFNAGTEYECLGLVVGKEKHHLCVVFLTHFAPTADTAGGVVHPYNDDVTLFDRGSDLSNNG